MRLKQGEIFAVSRARMRFGDIDTSLRAAKRELPEADGLLDIDRDVSSRRSTLAHATGVMTDCLGRAGVAKTHSMLRVVRPYTR